LGRASAKYLVHLLTNEQSFQTKGDTDEQRPKKKERINIGLAGGATLLNMQHQMPLKVKPFAPTHLYPALGFFPTESDIRFVNAVVIVSEMMARIEKSTGYWLPLPPLLNDSQDDRAALEQRREKLCELIANTPLVADLLKVVNNDLDIVFTGMGSISYDGEGALVAEALAGKNFVSFASKVDQNWRQSLESKKIIGDLSFLPFNEDGPVHIEALKWARMGIQWKSMCAMANRNRVVLVCGGVEKHETLYKLLMLERSRRPINVLITDITAAKFLESKIDEANQTGGERAGGDV
jgi:DNA-binding transcriptional regulator LsrR (DeoR family)